MGAANALYFIEQSAVSQRGLPQLGPVAPTATRNHIVNCGKGEVLVVEMSVKHGASNARYSFG
jgi:hypothetical protein